MESVINLKDKVYFARILPKVGIYDLCELTIRTVMDNYFVGIDKRDKQAHIFGYDRIGVDVFKERSRALEKIHIAEKNKKGELQETFYEEY